MTSNLIAMRVPDFARFVITFVTYCHTVAYLQCAEPCAVFHTLPFVCSYEPPTIKNGKCLLTKHLP